MRSHVTLLGILLVLCVGLLLLPSGEAPLRAAEAESGFGAPGESDVEAALQSAPLMFIENVGQFAEGARFQVLGAEGTLWLAEDALWITVMEPVPATDPMERRNRLTQAGEQESRNGVNIKLSFVGANPQPRLEPVDRLDTTVSYFRGSDPDGWRPDVPVWGSVRYIDLYPGIDLEITEENGRWQPTIVSKEAEINLTQVQLRIEGATVDDVDSGLLHLGSMFGPVVLPLPLADQAIYVLGETDEGIWKRFSTASEATSLDNTTNNRSADNPDELLYSGYLGGSSWDELSDIASDEEGNVYLSGSTSSVDFPTTPGSFGGTLGNFQDVFVAKVNRDGTQLQYASFIGGDDSGNEYGHAIAVDQFGNAYLAGEIHTDDFPVTDGAFDVVYDCCSETFVTKFNEEGTSLIYSTLLGGRANVVERITAIAVDSAGFAYVVGETGDSDFPTTTGVYDTSFNGYVDIFITKLNQAGSDLVYSTFLGGSDHDSLGHADITIDEMGDVYVVGTTESADFPTTVGAFDETYNGGRDVFITKLNEAGTTLRFSTYLGTGSDEHGLGIALDRQSNVYIVGNTYSSAFPVTPGSLDSTYGALGDGFITKFNSQGTILLYSTYLGGNGRDELSAVIVGEDEYAYATGHGGEGFPTTSNAFDTTFNGHYYDAIVAKINQDGSALSYSTFLGSDSSEWGSGIVIDNEGKATIAGIAGIFGEPTNFPTTPNAFDSTYGGEQEGFIAKLAMGASTTPTGQQLLLNPSFETGSDPDPWQWINQSNCTFFAYNDSTIAQDGDYYLATNRNSNSACTSFYQDVPRRPVAGEEYTFGIWVRSSDGSPRQGDLVLWALGGTAEQSPAQSFSVSGSEWHYVSTSLTVQQNDHTSMRAEVYLNTLDSVDYYFDNAQLVGPPRYSITGRVETSGGAGVGGVTVSSSNGFSQETDLNGNYTIGELPPGTYIVTPSKAGYTFNPSSRTVDVQDEGVVVEDFTANPIPDTTDPTGEITSPQEGATVTGPTVSIQVTAQDNEGGSGVARVRFYAYYNAAWHHIADDTASPYAATWTVPNGLATQQLQFGIHVEDHAGNYVVDPSAPVTVHYSPSFRPDQHGYSFNNARARTSWDIFRDTFGAEHVEWSIAGITHPYPLAELYYAPTYVKSVEEGACFGMAASSGLLFKVWADPSNFLASQGVSNASGLDAPPTQNSRWTITDVSHFILRYQGYQLGREYSNASRNYGRSLSQLVSDVTNGLDNNLTNPHILSVGGESGDDCAGHALTPYRYEQNGGVTKIFVYDSNHEGAANQHVSFNLAANSWSYNHNNSIGTWGSGRECAYIQALPLSLLRTRPTPPWSLLGLAAQSTDEAESYHALSVQGDAHLLIKDSAGRALGYRDGEFVSEIPGAMRVVPIGVIPGVSPDYPERYDVDRDTEFTMSIVYSDTGQATVLDFAPQGVIEVVGASSDPNATDTIEMSPDTQGVTLTAGSSASGRAITLYKGGADWVSEVAIEAFALDAGGIAEMELGVGGSGSQQVVFSSTSTDDYEVRMVQTSPTGETTFTASAITLDAGDTHLVTVDWTDTSSATLQIDRDSNGTIDETQTLHNEFTLRKIFMPLTIRR